MSQRFTITHMPVQKLTFNEAIERLLREETIIAEQVMIPKVKFNTTFVEFVELLKDKLLLNKLLRLISNNLYPELPAEFGYVVNEMKDSLLQLSPEDYLIIDNNKIITAFTKLLV